MRILFMAVAFVLMMSTTHAAIYQQGIVYVIYDEAGDAAPVDKTDLNVNGVPDVVEDIATQVNAARELFKDVFKFPDPLESERFNATSIEVDIKSKAVMGKYNGISGKKVRQHSKHNPNERAIHFRVANTVNPRKNSTPTHEYFHEIQYGATYFMNDWFKEGTARWAQDAVQNIKEYPDGKNIPSQLEDDTFAEQVYQGSYDMAKGFWYPLALNMNDKATIPDSLIEKYRYVDGSPVFRDNIIYGANVVREVIQVMKTKEELAAAEYGTLNEWRNKGRRDERNNKFIMASVREVYHGKL
ncbi:MAG: hypothetical protein IKD73_06045 [Selenomonadaceae bacterium]|nr:hypothetical protein [Selenomonadaceae bacterium]